MINFGLSDTASSSAKFCSRSQSIATSEVLKVTRRSSAHTPRSCSCRISCSESPPAGPSRVRYVRSISDNPIHAYMHAKYLDDDSFCSTSGVGQVFHCWRTFDETNPHVWVSPFTRGWAHLSGGVAPPGHVLGAEVARGVDVHEGAGQGRQRLGVGAGVVGQTQSCGNACFLL